MANIDEYIKQIQQAQYGEEVRGSIVNALKKVNDDNNSYVAIKKEVVAAKDIVEEKAEIFDEKANAAKETLTALQASTQIANEAKSSLNNIISSAISTKKELEQAVLETGEVIARVDNAKSNLDKSITSAGEAELNLQRQIETSNQIKNQLDVSNNTAIELKKNLDVAINEANTAKVKLVEAINNARNAALEKIETAQSVATRAVETAKVEVVKAVQTEGTTQTGAVTAEGEKQVQAVQAAAQEIVADREQIQKNKTDIADLRQKKADAIVESASGTLLNVKDSANALFEDFSVYGKSEQVQTTGANLLDYSKCKVNIEKNVEVKYDSYNITIKNNNNYPIIVDIPMKLGAGNYYLSSEKQISVPIYKENTWTSNGILNSTKGSFSVTEPGEYCSRITVNKNSSIDAKKLMCSKTEEAVYEPYTGGKPSPSPEYPQEIVNAGRLNEDTGKYEVDVKVTGKNLIPFPYPAISGNKGTKNGITWEVLTDGGIKLTGTANPETFYLDLDNNLKIGNTLIPPGGTDGRITVNKDVTYNGGIKKAYIAITKATTVNRVYYPQIEHGTISTSYEPYREPQTLTLQLDRPLTKWDRLEKREGVWGIARNSEIKELTDKEKINEYVPGSGKYEEGLHCYNIWLSKSALEYSASYCTHFKNVNYAFYPEKGENGIYSDHADVTIKYFISDKQTIEEFKTWLAQQKEAGTPVELVYKTAEETWEPLPKEMQSALNALHTNYPTTVVSNSEDTEMQLTYVADTKNYTDRKIEQAVSAQVQNLANLLSLMPLSTQAAMIENDTNNILDMEVQNE